jgi:aminopeptidase N
VAAKTLSFFTQYFGAAYPLPKMDMVAVPDFAAGAMENWGLITYRTVLALYDPASTGSAVKQQIAYVVCHELAHQWFGNLVTMTWWSDLWLNEGFATWAGWLAVDALFPEWRVWDQFLVNEQARGLELDGLASSHPIEVEIPDASKVNEIFDAISYAKGASAIHMLVAYMGEASFRQGMRLYVQRHAWGNAATRDLWRALGDASGKPVSDLMACWTQQTGACVGCDDVAQALLQRQNQNLRCIVCAD